MRKTKPKLKNQLTLIEYGLIIFLVASATIGIIIEYNHEILKLLSN